MRPSLTFTIKPNLPQVLAPLAELAGNLWFSWHAEAVDLWQRVDHHLWSQLKHNPVAMLNQVSQERLEALANDSGFLAQMERVADQMRGYLGAERCAFLNGRAPENLSIAYFSAEYGLADCLPLYSGGLGILSGDHLKSASDLNLPLAGIGLAYGQGYFTQYLDADGWQQEEYHPNDFWTLPMELMLGDDGQELTVEVNIEGRPLKARVWRVRAGRVPLYLMDANIEANPPDLRAVTYKLYGGDRQMRIRQEILLGIGGVRLLAALGIEPNVIHMNEGHSAFASLERIRQLKQEKGLSFDEAREVVRASNCFTTHTPVPAGNDYFDPELVRRHFEGYVQELGISMPVLMGYGRINPTDQAELFCMTVLALRLSGFANGVSRLHGQVSRNMWAGVWPHFPTEDLPITHVTNGVHIPSWISNDVAYLYYRYLGPGWHEDPDSQTVWKAIDEVPDGELWRVRERRRGQMVDFLRRTLSAQLAQRGASAEELKHAAEVLNPEALTIVFARRFATYKRAVLIAQDLDRLAKLLNDPQRPMQIIFAGKAHPKDNEGKEFIRRIAALTRDPRFSDRVVFIEDYDINTARYLVQGADIWLNTPRRPLEACGTSGMKSVANGGLHLSVLDGWWDEGFQPGLGWAIGRGEEHTEAYPQDEVEGRALYRLLENEVAPLFYRRDHEGLPRGWIAYVKKSLLNLCPEFNSHRMLEDYAELGYLPAGDRYNGLVGSDFAGARELGAWVRRIMENWGEVRVEQAYSDSPENATWGDELTIKARVHLGGLQPGEVAVDAYYGKLGADGEFAERLTHNLDPAGGGDGTWEFTGKIKAQSTGRLGLAVRVVPYHPLMGTKYALGLAAWG
ncbi:MAG: alpha-glucan family phosphorylase [Desulfarculaceae bacterium]|nr:alpha-glucan family phosphorylase [Desulfarculaceae bacterium]MCF8073052.1 alpha-glucan family phosphorylase [Desulfarculaceae bacterium]MCF8101863.1 alpha-glucan family phosphorylase [Desulfarculaceae bacterium]MCF8115390.1 alpha-glucan family phosphorylase [Desulfarculaceae bacterium]